MGKKTTRITIETEQFMVIRRRRVVRFWCSECGGEAEFVPRQAVSPLLNERPNQAGITAIASGPHFATAADGSDVVCVKSLLG